MNSKKSWWLLIIVSIGVMVPFLAPYLSFNPNNSRIVINSNNLQFPALVAHIIFACIALISGFFQFNSRIREKKPRIHRLLGRLYVISVFLSGLLAFAVIIYIENFAKATSFIALSFIWLFTCWKGYKSALKRNMSEHRKWMIRSFGITLVAVSGRVIVPILLLIYALLNGFNLPGGREQMVEEVLNVNIWVGLLLNIMIVEWIILSPKIRKNKDI
ncbi:DUF2306 domain-containing protein [Bacillus sp. EAC]|uniref:DUF2306 domain-containing protein n=1 Tax=Bacillus sp. EAC TaxID=1978338 RepID=UPI000B44CE95|nr:DUF2306 domain-containing protein [Bacillus sp. EAC]